MTLEVSFVIAEGDVWVDPDGTAWRVQAAGGERVLFERTAVTDEDPKTVVRNWRKVGDGP